MMIPEPSLWEKLTLGGLTGVGGLIALFGVLVVAMWIVAPLMLYGVYHRLGQIRDLLRHRDPAPAWIAPAARDARAPLSPPRAEPIIGDRLILTTQPQASRLPVLIACGILAFVIATVIFFSLH